jgi:RNA polymerase sigma-70 factor, ECF subfamily
LGSKEILERWIELYSARLVRVAYSYVHDWSAAEDRVQDAFIKVYEKIGQFKESSEPFPWLAKIVINECKMTYRKWWREVVSALLPEHSDESIEEIYLKQETNQTVYELVLKLPEPYRTPIVLFYFEELSIDEIADILGKSKGTIKSRLSRGRERLRRNFKECDYFGTATQEC